MLAKSKCKPSKSILPLWNYVYMRLFFKETGPFSHWILSPSWENSKILKHSVIFSVRFFCSSLDSADCVSEKASSQPLVKAAITNTEANLNESDCLDGKKLVAANVHNSSDQIPDDVTVTADEASPSFENSKFMRTVSPPTLGTPKSCFSWSGSLEDFARTPSPSPSTALQQFRRKSGSPCSPLEMNELSAVTQLKSNESGDESHPPHEGGWSSQSQESLELSPHNLNGSKLSQLSSKDSDSEVSHVMKPLFSNSYVRENRFLIR